MIVNRESLLIQLIDDVGLKVTIEEIASLAMRSAEREESFVQYNTRGSPFRGASLRLTDVAKALPREGLWCSNDRHKRE